MDIRRLSLRIGVVSIGKQNKLKIFRKSVHRNRGASTTID